MYTYMCIYIYIYIYMYDRVNIIYIYICDRTPSLSRPAPRSHGWRRSCKRQP